MSSGVVVREAVKGAAASIARDLAAGEELELFPLPVADDDGRIAAAAEPARKAGRPKGSQNLATREMREYLLKRGVLPQQALMSWLLMGPHGISEALRCDRAEAFDRWFRIAAELGKYFMAPMVPVDQDGKPAPAFLVQIGAANGALEAGNSALPPWEAWREQNQALTVDGEAQSKEAGE